MIEHFAENNEHIDTVIRDMIDTARRTDQRVFTEFNGIRLLTTPGEEHAAIRERFDRLQRDAHYALQANTDDGHTTADYEAIVAVRNRLQRELAGAQRSNDFYKQQIEYLEQTCQSFVETIGDFRGALTGFRQWLWANGYAKEHPELQAELDIQFAFDAPDNWYVAVHPDGDYACAKPAISVSGPMSCTEANALRDRIEGPVRTYIEGNE